MSFYQDDFYVDLHRRTLYPARVVLDILLRIVPDVQSAVDIGCAVGSWLSVLKEKGVGDIQGFDGDWVKKQYLEIPEACFQAVDLSKPLQIGRRYDLAMSLEVAEHLPAESARGFVASLTGLSDFVLFSAAIPHQGGTNHVNEQWLEYWIDLFDDQGYQGVDMIRRQIWYDEEIPFWYKQNLVLFVRRERLDDLHFQSGPEDYRPISLVHPQQYMDGKVALRVVRSSIRKKISRLF